MQTRLGSAIETAVNILVGMIVGLSMNALILPALGFNISLSQNLFIATAFTGVSIVRSYCLRRLFNRLSSRFDI